LSLGEPDERAQIRRLTDQVWQITNPPVKPPPFPVTARDYAELRDAISPARLTTYLRHAHGNHRLALELYAGNVSAGAALFPILHANEVALRNAINRALESQFGAQWPYAEGFLRTLPRPERATFEANRARLEKKRRVAHLATGDVVSGQNFYFWVALLTARYEHRLWKAEFARSFPGAPPYVQRALVHATAEEIRVLRNRIAHHEPLLAYDLTGAHLRAVRMIRWISPGKAAWAAGRWPAPPNLQTRP
jgi:hypothetical protein